VATLISKATDNFTAAGTWAPVATASLCELDSEAGSTNPGTGGGRTAAFTPAAEEIDAIALKLNTSPASPSGTLSVKLENQTNPGVREATVVINNADIPANLAAGSGGWYVFKFSAPVIPNGTDSYKIYVVSSAVTTFTESWYTDGTASNFSRMLRRTATPSAPAAGDKLIIAGEMTGQGTLNSFTVTMDNTATTSFGPTVSGGPPQGMMVCDEATLTFGTAASTNYYLKLKGVLAVRAGGTLNIGTSGTPIPSSSTAVLEFDSVANVDSGLNIGVGATFNAYGATKTSTSTLLTVDKAAAATTLTIGDTTGWAAGDVLGIASTTITPGQTESKTILTVDSGTTVTLTAGLGFAHSGTAPTQGEVINLTRNVKIRGVSGTLQGYIFAAAKATVTCRYTEFYWLGSGTVNKKGIDATTTVGGNFDMQFCALHDFIAASSIGFSITGAASTNIIYSNNVSYNMQSSHVSVAATTGTWTVSNCVAMLSIGTGTTAAFSIADVGGTFTNCTVGGTSGSTVGIVIAESAPVTGTFSGLTVHSCGSNGIQIQNIGTSSSLPSTIGAITAWRNALIGVIVTAVKNTVFTSITAFGNASSSNVIVQSGGGQIRFASLTLNADTTFGTSYGLSITSGLAFGLIEIENSDLGTASGIKAGHTNGDINISSAGALVQIVCRNTKMSSTTEVVNQDNMAPGSYVRSARHDQTAGLHRSWYPDGNIDIDVSVFRTASPSEKLTPINATDKLESGPKRAAVANGGTITFTTYVNKSAGYNGNQPRLILKKNVAAGITADTVLATASGGTGSWLTLSGTTAAVTDDAVLEVVVDCDGTAGTVNIDDWAAV
jgi:hypothetical protein